MDPLDIALATFGLFLAGVIKGATGLGYASVALPFLVMTIGLTSAMGLVILPTLASNFSVTLTTPHVRETVQRFAPLYASMLPGVIAGLWLLTWVDQRTAVQVLGVVMMVYCALALARPSLRINRRGEAWLQWPTGVANGVVTGLTGAQIMPLFPYIMALGMDPARTVQAVNLAVLVASTVLAIGLVAAGLVPPGIYAWSFAAILPALAGIHVGTRARGRLSDAAFRRVALLTLALMGFMLLVR
jgi:hypothetical protein